MNKAWLILLLVTAVSLSGCSGDDAGTDATSETTTGTESPTGTGAGTATGSGTQTGSPDPEENATQAGPVQVIEGSFLAGNPAQGCVLAVYTFGPDNGITRFGAELLPESLGRHYTVEFTPTLPAAGYLVGFSSGGTISTDQATAPDTTTTTLTGKVPKDAEAITAAACGGGMIDVLITIE